MERKEKLSKGDKTKKFIKESRRVLRVTRKPDKSEFLNLVKVTGLGIAIVGIIGFVIFLLKQIFL